MIAGVVGALRGIVDALQIAEHRGIALLQLVRQEAQLAFQRRSAVSIRRAEGAQVGQPSAAPLAQPVIAAAGIGIEAALAADVGKYAACGGGIQPHLPRQEHVALFLIAVFGRIEIIVRRRLSRLGRRNRGRFGRRRGGLADVACVDEAVMPVVLDQRPLAIHGEQPHFHPGGDADVAARQVRRFKHERVLYDDGVLRVFQQIAVIRRRRRHRRRGCSRLGRRSRCRLRRRIGNLTDVICIDVAVMPIVFDQRPLAVLGEQPDFQPGRDADVTARHIRRFKYKRVRRDDGVLRIFQQIAVIRRRRRRDGRLNLGQERDKVGINVGVGRSIAHHSPVAVDGDQLDPHPLWHT